MKTIYVAGPMTGYPEFNFPAFFAAQERLERDGWRVKNPAQKDLEANLDTEACETGDATLAVQRGFDFKAAFMWDMEAIIHGDAIYMLKGWEKSGGARAEWATANVMKAHNPAFEIIYE